MISVGLEKNVLIFKCLVMSPRHLAEFYCAKLRKISKPCNIVNNFERPKVQAKKYAPMRGILNALQGLGYLTVSFLPLRVM